MKIFTYNRSEFSVDIERWEKDLIIELPQKYSPTGTFLVVDKWFPTKPPMPFKFKEIVVNWNEEPKVVKATLIKGPPADLILEKGRELKRLEIKNLIRNQRLRFKFRMTLREYLDFTYEGLLQYIQMCIYPHGHGELKDWKFKIDKETTEKELVLDINCDPKNLF